MAEQVGRTTVEGKVHRAQVDTGQRISYARKGTFACGRSTRTTVIDVNKQVSSESPFKLHCYGNLGVMEVFFLSSDKQIVRWYRECVCRLRRYVL